VPFVRIRVAPAWLGYALNGITLLARRGGRYPRRRRDRRGQKSITRHVREGNPCVGHRGRRPEIALAVLATTALVVVFLPTAFMSGIPVVFKQFGWTIVAAVIASCS
jgi:hypothetical protein